VKLLKGKHLKSDMSFRNQPDRQVWCTFCLDGSASILIIGQRLRESGIFGCVIALGHIQWLGLRIAVLSGTKDAGIMALIDPS
jgi:hypothetical protein